MTSPIGGWTNDPTGPWPAGGVAPIVPTMSEVDTSERAAGERGTTLVEFTFVIGILALFLSGIITFGLILASKQTITQAASEGARAAVTSPYTQEDLANPSDSRPVKEALAQTERSLGWLDRTCASDGDAAANPPRESQAVQDDEPGGGQKDAQTHALDLLDQLRAAILAPGAAGSADLAGVIADLEVAATPPGALPPDDLAELRDALFAARENPRDVDTIVDLTKRIEALVSLVIAYDRAIAAIERSLDALREEGDG